MLIFLLSHGPLLTSSSFILEFFLIHTFFMCFLKYRLCVCLCWICRKTWFLQVVCILQRTFTVYAWHMYVSMFAYKCVWDSCLVRRACYFLTGWDRWSEMHDGILWWAGRVWINMVDFSSPCCVCVCVCVCVWERERERETIGPVENHAFQSYHRWISRVFYRCALGV